MKYYRNHVMWEDFHWHQKAAVLNNSSLGNLHKEEKRLRMKENCEVGRKKRGGKRKPMMLNICKVEK